MQSLPPGSSRLALVTGTKLVSIVLLVAVLISLYGIWRWFFCRLEVASGKAAVLIAKTGQNLPSGQIIASEPGQKGIQLAPLPEGRYFRNPVFWDWTYVDVVDIPAGKLGVVIRQYGRDATQDELQRGQVLAGEGQKGILQDVLLPGRHRINPYAYRVELHNAIHIDPGFVGVVTNMVGAEPKVKNRFLVDKGERGVQREVFLPGTYYLNPYMTRVDLVDTRSQRLDLAGAEVLKFPSIDGFEITVLATVEWSIDPMRAAEVFVRIGQLSDKPDDNEVLQKVLIPAVRGFGRTEGSKYSAPNYISGESRLVFQNTLFDKLKAFCEPRGILIKSMLINDIEPPQEIASPIRDREIAKEELARNRNQLIQAQAEQRLAREEELVKQQQDKVRAETTRLQKVIAAKNRQEVALIEQEKLLTVASTDLEAAKKEAQAIKARGQAEADVIGLEASAEAEALHRSVEAFQAPTAYTFYEFVQKIAPRIEAVFANTDSPMGQLFEGFLPIQSNGATVSPAERR
jgi:regulator of protease activity HflC (stomatin/prohibitin superfamily)